MTLLFFMLFITMLMNKTSVSSARTTREGRRTPVHARVGEDVRRMWSYSLCVCVCVFTTTVSCIRFNFQALFDFCSLWDPVSDFGVLLLLLLLLLL